MNPRLVVALVLLAILVLGTAMRGLLSGGEGGSSSPTLSPGGPGPIAESAETSNSELSTASGRGQDVQREEASITTPPIDIAGSFDPVAGPATGVLEGRITNEFGAGIEGVQLTLLEQLVPPHLALLAPQTNLPSSPPRSTQSSTRWTKR